MMEGMDPSGMQGASDSAQVQAATLAQPGRKPH